MSDNQYYNTRLQELGNESFTSVDFPLDIRGLPVTDNSGLQIGTVTDLLLDRQSRKVRYAVLEIETGSSNRKILAPVGLISITRDESLEVQNLTSELINALPDYLEGQVNPGVENIVRLAYQQVEDQQEVGTITGHPEAINSDQFYNNALFRIGNIFSFSSKDSKVVEAVFDDSIEAESAITELLANGFSTEDVELSSAESKSAIENSANTPSVSNGGSVISVKVNNGTDAEKATEIFNKNGSVSVFQHRENG